MRRIKKQILSLCVVVSLVFGLVPETLVKAVEKETQVTTDFVSEEVTVSAGDDMILLEETVEETEEQLEEFQTTVQDEAAIAKEQLCAGSGLYARNSTIRNEYLEIAVTQEGVFTIGAEEGNPNYSSDNNEILLYGHPSPGTSRTLLVVDGEEYWFSAQDVSIDSVANVATAVMYLGDVTVTETLSFYTNPATGRGDTVRISYSVHNRSANVHTVGIRIMMDTMLAWNDYAPFKIPGYGNVTESKVLEGDAITQTFQVYDDLDTPTTMATGTLWLGDERRPDKVQYCNWPGISGSSWNHSVTDGEYLGDSAVGIYYNPVTIAAGSGMSVSTYYGTGMDLESSEDGNISVENPIGSKDFQLIITNSKNGNSVSGATVELAGIGSVTTGRLGEAVFENVDESFNNQTVTATITHEDYQPTTVDVKVELSKSFNIQIRGIEDTAPVIDSVVMTSVNTKFDQVDLLSQTVYLNSNPTGVAATKNNTEMLQINVSSDMDGCVYQLYAGNDMIQQNETGIFELTTITNNGKGKTYTTNRICDIDAGKKLYVKAVSATGEASNKRLLGVKISEPSQYSTTIASNVSIFQSFSIQDLKDAEEIISLLLGVDELNISAGLLPLEVEIDEDGKVKVAYNKGKDTDWDSFKGNYDKAVLQRAGALKNFGGKTSSLGIGKLKADMSVCGYGEGYITDGKLCVNIGIVGSVELDASYTHTFFLGWVPVYITCGAQGEASLSLGASVISEDGLDLKITSGSFEPAFSLYLEGGVGASGVLSAGVQGRGTLKYINDFVDDYRRLSLTAKASVEVHALLYSNSINIAEKTWTLYDSNAETLDLYNSAEGQELYEESNFEVTPRYYQTIAASDSELEWENGVYTDSRPRVIKVDDSKYYRFWVNDISTRDDLNRTAICYSVADEYGLWSTPVILNDDGTADYNFDVAVADNKIYVVYQEASKVYSENELEQDALTAAVGDCQVSLAVINVEDETIENVGCVSTEVPDMIGALLPGIAVNNNVAHIVWYTNSANNILAGTDAEGEQNTLYYKNLNLSDSSSVVKTFTVGGKAVTSLDTGFLNGEIAISYVQDVDGDLVSVADRELYFVSELDSEAVTVKIEKGTNDADMDAAPVFAKIAGVDSLVWYGGGNYYVTQTTVDEAVAVFAQEQIPGNANNSFAVLEGDGEAAIAWNATGSNSNEVANIQSLYVVKYENGAWGHVYEAMNLGDVESPVISSLSGYIEDDLCHVTYGIVGYNDDGMVELSSIYAAEEEEYERIALVDVEYDSNQVVAGQPFVLKATISNTGTTTVNQAELFVEWNSYLITDMNLLPGEQKTFDVNVTLEAETAGTYPIYVESTEDKGFVVYANYTEISVEQKERVLLGNTEFLTFEIKNNSAVPAENVNFKVILDNVENGAVAYDYSMTESLKPGESMTAMCPVSAMQNAPVAYGRLVTSTEELVTGNNIVMICNNVEIPDVITTNILEIAVNEAEAGSVIVPDGYTESMGVYSKNCDTNEEVEVEAVPAEGYAFVGWTVEGKGSVASKYAQKTSFYMGDGDARLIANFATESHIVSITLDEVMTVEMGSRHTLSPVVAPVNTSDHLVWSSSDESVVTVDEDGEITAVGIGEAEITVRSSWEEENTIQATCVVTVTGVELTDLRMVYAEVELEGIGATETVNLLKTPMNATEKVVFVSEDENVVTVDENGIMTAVGAGTTTVTAMTEDADITASCTVTVTIPLTGIYFEEATYEMNVDESRTIGFTMTPENATTGVDPEDIQWTCSDEYVCEIIPSADRRSVTVKALYGGTATITVSVGNSMTAFCRVSVKKSYTSIVLMDKPEILPVGYEGYLAYGGEPYDANGTITFSSSNTSVASVDNYGYLCTYQTGETTITIQTDNGLQDSFVLRVANITLSQSNIQMGQGETVTVSCVSVPENALNTLSSGLTWSVNNSQICSVTPSADGKSATITGLTKGSTTVYVMANNNVLASVNVSVNVFINASSAEEIQTEHNYSNGMDTVWQYVVPGATSLTLTLNEQCATESGYDYFEIYGGTSVGYLYYFTSRTLYNAEGDVINNWTVEIPGNTVRIRFHSDGSVSAYGLKVDSIVAKYPPAVSIAPASVTVANCTYNGQEQKPKVTVKMGTTVLTLNKDYTVSYKNNKKAGTATVTITGKGKYTGTKTATFTIAKAKMTSKNLKVSTIKSQTYSGKSITPSVTVKYAGKTLKKGTDYTVSYKNNKKIGTATVTITGEGSFTGTKKVTFKIVKRKMTSKNLKVSTIKSQSYTGKKISPSITVKYAGKTLKKGTDYTVTYKNNVKIGKAQIVIKGKGNYEGTKKIQFTIVPKKPTISKVTSKKGKVTVKWNTVKGAKSYKVYYSTKKNGTYKLLGTSKKNSLSSKKLKPKNTYYIKVVAYNGSYKSAYSTPKKHKVNK